MNVGAPEVLGLIALVVPVGILGLVIYWAVKAAIRNAARDAVDEVVVRLLDYGWRPPGQLPPEAAEIRRQDQATS